MKIMEVCGTHTAAIFKSGIRDILPDGVRLVSGPGCPVCVTPPSYIKDCIEIAQTPGRALLCFGDMMKVPSPSGRTLSDAMAEGADVRMIYSPFDAIEIAKANTNITFTVAAVGFETTAPAYALLTEEAETLGIDNIDLITSLKSAIRAIEWICESGEDIDAFICPGHVSVITGSDVYLPLAEKYQRPFVIAGFEPEPLYAAVKSCISDGVGVRNMYPAAVTRAGNQKALALLEKYFDLKAASWRGLGEIAASGYVLKEEYAHRNAPFSRKSSAARGADDAITAGTPNTTDTAEAANTEATADKGDELPVSCRCGEVVLGRIDPPDCPLFATACTPLRAEGPCMVSSEGACGIWYRNRT